MLRGRCGGIEAVDEIPATRGMPRGSWDEFLKKMRQVVTRLRRLEYR